jgi:adenylate cyclase
MWKIIRKQLWTWRGLIISVPAVTGLVIGVRLTGIEQPVELAALDQFFIHRPLEKEDSRIVIVDVTEKDVRKIGKWPMSDDQLAQIIKNIKQQQPRVIGLDIYRDLPQEPGHKNLVDVYKSTPNLIGIQKIYQQGNSAGINPPPELKELNQIGANDMPLDGDGKVRRGLLYVDDLQGNTIESFALKLSLIYLKQDGIVDKAADSNPNYLQLGKAVFRRFEANDGGYINTDSSGYQLQLNYRANNKNFARVSLTDTLENSIPDSFFKDKIVLIGASADSLNDLFWSPYSSKMFTKPEQMPGVIIHANLVSQIISGALDGRQEIKVLPEPLEYLLILIASIIGGGLCWQQKKITSDDKLGPILIIVSVFIAGGGIITVSFLAFLNSWWIPVVPGILALGWSAAAVTQYLARSAAEMRHTFGRYLTDEVVANLLENPSGLLFGGDRRKVTVLMSDLRGFSATSERLPPEKVVTILNIYLAAMADVINQYQGTINEFIGDGIFVMFGAPVKRDDDSQRAIACALGMQLAMKEVNEKMREMNLPNLEMGIGINTGEVVAGNIGSQKRAKYGLVGSHVNLTSRIESYTVGGQILISQDTLTDANADLRIDGEMQVQPKGIKEPITIYDIGGIGGKFKLYLPQNDTEMIPLEEEIYFEYTIVSGKDAKGDIFSGVLVSISENGAMVRSPQNLEALTNIKINLLVQPESIGDLYAKVMKSTMDKGCYLIRFTATPPKAADLFKQLIS